ncbi:hypothetical protein ACIBG7_04055 [Nonomuraea sp. NPDC050328]|uniref:hypothetical protein n=1 Tax=Nonomuraea sp. NPDC050328 TaxID=3364361 RepID=UPI003797C0DC
MRMILVAALTLMVSAAPAQAAPPDPVKALKKQAAAGRGVLFTERSFKWAGVDSTWRGKGRLQYGKSGITGSEVSGTIDFPGDRPERERTIRVGGASYHRADSLAPKMPPGKAWLKETPGRTRWLSANYVSILNAAEPAALAAILAGAERDGRSYRGEIPFARLLKASPWARATPHPKFAADAVLSWRLDVTAGGLPYRLTTYGPGGQRLTEVRYSGWGAKVSVKAPPKDEVTTKLAG